MQQKLLVKNPTHITIHTQCCQLSTIHQRINQTIFTCRGDVQKVTSTPYGALPGDSGAPVMPGTRMTRVAEIQCNSGIENIYKKYHKIICGDFNYYYIILSSLYISGNKIDTLICREFLTRNSSRSRFVRSKSWTCAMLW